MRDKPLHMYVGKNPPTKGQVTVRSQTEREQSDLDAIMNFIRGYFCYSSGNEVEAFKHYKLAAEKGHAGAQFCLGVLYECDRVVEINFVLAFKYILMAADQSDNKDEVKLTIVSKDRLTESDKRVGEFFDKQYPEIMVDLKRQARQKVGCYYYLGENGVKEDRVKALYYFKLAADQGMVEAQLSAAMCYFQGAGTDKDLVQACHYWEMAANQGNVDAQHRIALHYSDGSGVEQNFARAFHYFKLAADQGFAEAQYFAALEYQIGDNVKRDPIQAFRYFKLAADQGQVNAQFSVANYYLNGSGVQKDPLQAFHYFKLAADQGLAKAQLLVGDYYAKGIITEKDMTKGWGYWKRAADQGNVEGQMKLGGWYILSGTDPDMGWKYLQQAADQGNEKAKDWIKKGFLPGSQKAVVEQGNRSLLSNPQPVKKLDVESGERIVTKEVAPMPVKSSGSFFKPYSQPKSPPPQKMLPTEEKNLPAQKVPPKPTVAKSNNSLFKSSGPAKLPPAQKMLPTEAKKLAAQQIPSKPPASVPAKSPDPSPTLATQTPPKQGQSAIGSLFRKK